MAGTDRFSADSDRHEVLRSTLSSTQAVDSGWGRADFWPGGVRWHGIVWLLAIFGAYTAAIQLYPWIGEVAVLWLPNAVLVTALLRFRPRDWPYVYVAGILAEVVGDLSFDMGPDRSLPLGVVNSIEATLFVVVAALIAGGRNRIGLLSVRGAMAVIVASVTVPVLTGSLGGAIVEASWTFGADYFTAWRTWWFGDSLGLLAGVPLGLLLRDAARSVGRRRSRLQQFGGGGLAALLFAASGIQAANGYSWGAQQTAIAAAVLLALTYGAIGAPTGALFTTTVAIVGVVTLNTDLGSVPRDQVLLFIVFAAIYVIAASTESAARTMNQLTRARNDLAVLSRTDELTGLANRRVLAQNLDLLWAWCIREAKPVSMLMVDIDCFHKYNETYGHVSGDSVLRRVGPVIKGAARRKTDLAVRYGGEEFLIVLPDTSLETAEGIAGQIHQQIKELNIEHSSSPVAPLVTVSIGVLTIAKAAPGSAIASLERCDALLFEAKRAGRNRTVAAAAA